MKTLGVISDTHLIDADQNLSARIYQVFEGVDLILHAGDLTSLAIIDLLGAIAPVEAVSGNMDETEVKKELPFLKILELEGCKIGLIHGWGPPWGIRNRIREKFEKVDAIVYGHTHQPFCATEGGIFFFNPGTASQSRWTRQPSCGKLRIGPSVSGEIISL